MGATCCVGKQKTQPQRPASARVVEAAGEEVQQQGRLQLPAAVLQASRNVSVHDFDLLKVIGGSWGQGKLLAVRHKAQPDQLYRMQVRRTALSSGEAINTRDVEREVMLMSMLDSPFIVKLRYVVQRANKAYFVMDYVSQHCLMDPLRVLGRLSDALARLYAAEVILALEHMHSRGVVLGVWDASQIMLSTHGHVRIADLARAGQLDGKTRSVVLSPRWDADGTYQSPEQVTENVSSVASDMWALGVMLFEMLTGLPPFYSVRPAELRQMICSADPKMPSVLSPSATRLVRWLLAKNPRDRPADMAAAKQHDFFAAVDWEAVAQQRVVPEWTPPAFGANDPSPVFYAEEGISRRCAVTEQQQHQEDNFGNDFHNFSYIGP